MLPAQCVRKRREWTNGPQCQKAQDERCAQIWRTEVREVDSVCVCVCVAGGWGSLSGCQSFPVSGCLCCVNEPCFTLTGPRSLCGSVGTLLCWWISMPCLWA